MPVTKVDFKRELSGLYAPPSQAVIVTVPELAFAMIDGHGDPNTSARFAEAIEALYGLSFTAKFAVKRAPGGVDFTVMPLEGLWWTGAEGTLDLGHKSGWNWTLMIMQPAPVDDALFAEVREQLSAKKPSPALDAVRLQHFEEGLCAQVMYRGPYADEGPAIAKLRAFIADQGCVPAGKHHEIYLGDPRRSAPEKLKTSICQPMH